jgi:ComF family protein
LRFSSVTTLGPYRGRLREAVILMKKKRYELLRRSVGELIAEELRKSCTATVPVLVPVPNHWTRNMFRSFCQATSLAQSIALANDWPMFTNLIWRNRKTSKQGMLSWTDRTQNVRGAFSIKAGARIKGRHVIVVDDVLTSGATANEISKLLVSVGASGVSIAVAARGTGAREIVVQPAAVLEKELS